MTLRLTEDPRTLERYEGASRQSTGSYIVARETHNGDIGSQDDHDGQICTSTITVKRAIRIQCAVYVLIYFIGQEAYDLESNIFTTLGLATTPG